MINLRRSQSPATSQYRIHPRWGPAQQCIQAGAEGHNQQRRQQVSEQADVRHAAFIPQRQRGSTVHQGHVQHINCKRKPGQPAKPSPGRASAHQPIEPKPGRVETQHFASLHGLANQKAISYSAANCRKNRMSFSVNRRKSLIWYLSMAMRSIPMPQA